MRFGAFCARKPQHAIFSKMIFNLFHSNLNDNVCGTNSTCCTVRVAEQHGAPSPYFSLCFHWVSQPV